MSREGLGISRSGCLIMLGTGMGIARRASRCSTSTPRCWRKARSALRRPCTTEVITYHAATPSLSERAHLVSSGTGPQVSFTLGNAEKLETVADNSIDLYTIAFGIRNCTHIDQVLKEAYRVLKPGGVFSCLEFSKVTNPLLAQWVPSLLLDTHYL